MAPQLGGSIVQLCCSMYLCSTVSSDWLSTMDQEFKKFKRQLESADYLDNWRTIIDDFLAAFGGHDCTLPPLVPRGFFQKSRISSASFRDLPQNHPNMFRLRRFLENVSCLFIFFACMKHKLSHNLTYREPAAGEIFGDHIVTNTLQNVGIDLGFLQFHFC